MSLREVVSRIIEELDVSDKEEEMANAVNEVEQEEISREGKMLQSNGILQSDQRKVVFSDLESEIRLYYAVDPRDNLIQIISERL